ncbi:MAG: DUF192 domain-containing protein [Lysobacterales bacterium]|nr:DUF192 domain-containing protein [Xanthomonadales bacterium]MCB1613718.1 DUF192 domain-containing protein [Xanthomonadales bacterium]MCP5475879.1 DUF192 domain-containing protein [Rhodanobacteraceae bacterium]
MRWLWALMVLASAACTTSTPVVVLRDHAFRVEIADDDAERTRGLMYREHLDADAGMLFLFERQEPQAFWMKNTRIPLDILYFDQSWSLVGWSLNTPPCSLGNQCPSYPSGAPARYVLELNAGTANNIGAQLGDKLDVGSLKTE